MSQVSVTVESHVDEVIEAKKEAVKRALEAIGIEAERQAKMELESSPRRIDTGLLRNSITHAVGGQTPAISHYASDDGSKSGGYSGTAGSEDDESVYIGTNVEYAIYVHEGTMKMSPNRFLRNAVQDNADRYKQIAEMYMKGG